MKIVSLVTSQRQKFMLPTASWFKLLNIEQVQSMGLGNARK